MPHKYNQTSNTAWINHSIRFDRLKCFSNLKTFDAYPTSNGMMAIECVSDFWLTIECYSKYE